MEVHIFDKLLSELDQFNYILLCVIVFWSFGTSRKGACWLGPTRLRSCGLDEAPRRDREVFSFLRVLSEGKISTVCCRTGNWGIMGELADCSTTNTG